MPSTRNVRVSSPLERELDGRPDRELVVAGVPVVHEGAVLAEVGEHLLRPFLPVDEDHLARGRVHRRREDDVTEGLHLAGADVHDRVDAGRLGHCVGGLDGIGLKLFCAVSA